VSALSGCSTSGRLASGAYDGAIRVWGRGGACLSSFAAHPGGVTAAAWLPVAQGALLLTGGKDAGLRLWSVPGDGHGGGGKGKAAAAAPPPALVAECVGHTDAVAAVAVAPSGEVAASGGWDGRLVLWQTGAAGDWARAGGSH
jgi:ribosome biogenesis protein YTM1